jgi:hypothetical protein
VQLVTEQVVLVDLENVRGLDLTRLPAHARIKVFAGESQSRLPTDLVEEALKLGSRFELVRIKGNGPNALDFHIACHLGEGICKYPKAEFVILSNDKGFDPSCGTSRRASSSAGAKARRVRRPHPS